MMWWRARTITSTYYLVFLVPLLTGTLGAPSSLNATQPPLAARRPLTPLDFQPNIQLQHHNKPLNGSSSRLESDYNSEEAEASAVAVEMQQSSCSISTEQLVASAQASVTRVLKGLCNEQKIEEYVKDMIDILGAKIEWVGENVERIEARVEELAAATASLRKTCSPSNQQSHQTVVYQCDPQAHPLSGEGKLNESRKKAYIAELYENGEGSVRDRERSVREDEILKFNSTIHFDAESSKKVFRYYWRLPHIHHKLTKWSPKRSIRSESFYIYPGGYRLYLLSYPRHGEDKLFVQVGITTGDFDRALQWPFGLKLMLTILDQSSPSAAEDLASRVWDPTLLCTQFNWQRPAKGDNEECVGLQLPHHALQPRYISQHDDSLLITLTVFLES